MNSAKILSFLLSVAPLAALVPATDGHRELHLPSLWAAWLTKNFEALGINLGLRHVTVAYLNVKLEMVVLWG
ncbi:hypothetical protein BBP40_011311 [Aspergillus hancockii]|nr:hypothetical protein BBP40_011311 [Aspergillus hancockii]